MEKKEIKKTALEIIDLLCDKSGFDDWWYNLSNSTENKIIKEIEDVINKRDNKSK